MYLEDCVPGTYTMDKTPASEYITLRLTNIMANGGGDRRINGQAFICFGDDVLYTGVYNTTMQETVQKINAMTTLTTEQKEAVCALYAQYQEIMDAWFEEGTNNIATWAPVAEEEEPSTETTEPTETTETTETAENLG